MDLGNLLASAAYGGVKGWVAGQHQENQQAAQRNEEERQQRLLEQRQQRLDSLNTIGYTETGAPVTGRQYEAMPKGTPLYDKALSRDKKESPTMQSDVGKLYSDLREMGVPDEEARQKALAEGSATGKSESAIQQRYNDAIAIGYDEDTARRVAAGGKPETDRPKDDTDRRKLYMDARDKFLSSVIQPTPEDEAKADQYAAQISGWQPEGMASQEQATEYPEANPGHTRMTSNYKETAKVVASDLAKGKPMEDVELSLVEAGWTEKEMKKIFKQVEESYGNIIRNKKPNPAAQTPQEKKSAQPAQKGKKIDTATAKEYIRQNKGDMQKAMAAAKKDGWVF